MNMNLLRLPNEILRSIAGLATDEDLKNIRVTCKTIEAATHQEFLDRYILERSHVMSPFGIQKLVEITAHSSFGQHIRTVTFNITTDDDPYARWPDHFLDKGAFVEMVKKIFANLKQYQEGKDYKIKVGFTDSFPGYQEGCCSDPVYRIAEKPSCGWYDLKLNRRNVERSHVFTKLRTARGRPRYPRSHGLIIMGDAITRVLPVAIKSGCSIAGLEIRLVGRLHFTERTLDVHHPSIHEALHNVETPADWDMKISVLDKSRTALSTITHTAANKMIEFRNFCLGDLDISQPFAYAYNVVYRMLRYKSERLEFVGCHVSDAGVMVAQLRELVDFQERSSSAKMERIVIDGLWICDNKNWDKIFLALSKIKTLKRCSVQGLRIAPEDEGNEEDDEHEEAAAEDENEGGKGDKPNAKRELAQLADTLAGVSIAVNEARGHDVTGELLDLAGKVSMRA